MPAYALTDGLIDKYITSVKRPANRLKMAKYGVLYFH